MSERMQSDEERRWLEGLDGAPTGALRQSQVEAGQRLEELVLDECFRVFKTIYAAGYGFDYRIEFDPRRGPAVVCESEEFNEATIAALMELAGQDLSLDVVSRPTAVLLVFSSPSWPVPF
jgi:hypothetical protein